MSQHGIRATEDRRRIHARCTVCNWSTSVDLGTATDTKAYYRAAKDHCESTGHEVNLDHLHEVTYQRRST